MLLIIQYIVSFILLPKLLITFLKNVIANIMSPKKGIAIMYFHYFLLLSD